MAGVGSQDVHHVNLIVCQEFGIIGVRVLDAILFRHGDGLLLGRSEDTCHDDADAP